MRAVSGPEVTVRTADARNHRRVHGDWMRKIRRNNGVVHEVDESKVTYDVNWRLVPKEPKRVKFICGYYAKMSRGTTNRDVPEETPTTCIRCALGASEV